MPDAVARVAAVIAAPISRTRGARRDEGPSRHRGHHRLTRDDRRLAGRDPRAGRREERHHPGAQLPDA